MATSRGQGDVSEVVFLRGFNMPKKKQNVAKDVGDFRRLLQERLVLILGPKFPPDRKTFLDKIKNKLESKEMKGKKRYFPLSVTDIETCIDDLPCETRRQKMCWLISSSKFVIIEDTYPSGAIMELEYCRNCGVLTAVIYRTKNKGYMASDGNNYQYHTGRSTSMTLDLEVHSKDFKSFSYKDDENKTLENLLKRILSFVKKRLKEREKEYNKLKRQIWKTK